MKTVISLCLLFLSFILNEIAIAQNPSFFRDNGSKYITFPSQYTNNDFKDATQLRLGTYLTMGNFGLNNHSWIGNNAILDYTSYGNVGTDGDKNKFKPVYNSGKALVMHLNWSNARLTGYTYSWNSSSTAVDLGDFETSWFLGPDKSYFYNNVGIGTTAPAHKLDVNGTIRAKEIKVETGWSDFVFEEDYTLKSLKEVETYIAKNKHLPDIPSKKEVKAKGINLGEMNAKLLQKIEELTLYVIKQNKQNRLQQNEIIKLKQKVDNLEKKL